MLTLTKHFQRRWIERVGSAVPSADEIEEMIEGAVELQKFRKAYTPRMRSITFLALYWMPKAGIVIKADTRRQQAVTVITEACLGPQKKEDVMCNAMCRKPKTLFFRCPDCGHRGESGELLPPGDGELRCPKCGGYRWRWEN